MGLLTMPRQDDRIFVATGKQWPTIFEIIQCRVAKPVPELGFKNVAWVPHKNAGDENRKEDQDLLETLV